MNEGRLVLILVVFSMLLFVPMADAQIESITAWTDKPEYSWGDKGVLYIAFRNTKDFGIKIENVTVIYEEWQAYIEDEWVGNETHTVKDEGVDVGKGDIYTVDVVFTVPDDGRARSTAVNVNIGTDFGSEFEPHAAFIEVSEAPIYMEQIVTLFTVLVVLVIVCTIIIAATIFLSVHRPKVAWREEEKSQ